MDAVQILQLEPKLDDFLKRFDDCFSRKDTRAHWPVLVKGQLSDLPEKSVEPIALEAGVAPRTLQEFLSLLKWNENQRRDRLQQIVRDEQASPQAVGICDETSDAKKGDKTPGVQKQWCGRLGKTENGIVTVHLGYAAADLQRWRVKDGEKGPVVWECKHVLFYPKDENGLPGAAQHLIVARNVLDPTEIKFFISNAPANTSIGTLLKVAFSRWRIERCFEDQKGEIGLDQYEGRRYLGLKRHLILSSVSYLFLARVREEWGGEKYRADGVPAPHGDGGVGAFLVA
jgi:SRSO17 transposase